MAKGSFPALHVGVLAPRRQDVRDFMLPSDGTMAPLKQLGPSLNPSTKKTRKEVELIVGRVRGHAEHQSTPVSDPASGRTRTRSPQPPASPLPMIRNGALS